MSICLEIKVWNGTQSNRMATFQDIIITDGDITWVYHHLYIYLGENISIFLIKTLDEKILTEIKKNSLIFLLNSALKKEKKTTWFLLLHLGPCCLPL